MGDRGNIAIKDGYGYVFLYTHWGGSLIAGVLRRALAKKSGWEDPSYLARIIFQEMLNGDTGTTGYGIGLQAADDVEHPILVVDCDTRTVIAMPIGWVHDSNVKPKPLGRWTFEEFVTLKYIIDQVQRL